MMTTKLKVFRFSCLLILLSLVFTSCSDGVITRNKSGYRTKARTKLPFNAIKKKVALMKFLNESAFGREDLEITATEEVRKELVRTGEFTIDPSAIKMFGSSKEIYAGGGAKLTQLARKAKLAGINFVVFGRILEARVREKKDEIGFIKEKRSFTESKVEIRIFDVHSNKEIFTQLERGYADDRTFQFFMSNQENDLLYRQELLRYGVKVAIRKLIPDILKVAQKLDWVGRVAKVIGNKVYLNAGRSSGMNIGDILRIKTEGREIFDPETGALIGVSEGETKGTLEIIDYFGPDGAIAILHSGGSVVEGDFVQLY